MARHPDTRALGEVKPTDITHLWEQHKEILRMLVLGYKANELALQFNVSEVFISNLRNSPLARDHLEILEVARDAATMEVSRDLIETAPKAKNILKKIITGDTDATLAMQVETAKDWLSRAGFPKLQKTETKHTDGIDSQTLSMLKDRALEASKEASRHEVKAEFTVAEETSS